MPLTADHITARLNAAKFWIESAHPWDRTFATDEKRFCKDGNDNEKSWLLDEHNKTLPNRKKRQMTGGSIMVWGAIASNGMYMLHRVEGTMKSPNYLDLLDNKVIPWMDAAFPDSNYHFLQDNAAVHTAKIVTAYFEEKNINVLKWPARSSDLNCIEN